MSRSSRIVELVGPPGSGKSTLTEILQRHNESVAIVTAPNFREIKYTSFFAANLIRLIPDLLGLFFRSKGKRFPNKRDIALMTILTGWNLALKKIPSSGPHIIILEEGAICLLAKLHGFSSHILRDRCADEWWHKTYHKWAETLDTVVLLDSSIPVLLKRIRSRELQFEIEEMPDKEALEYLERIQAAENQILENLIAEPMSPKLFRFSTDKSPDQIYAEVIQVLQDDHQK